MGLELIPKALRRKYHFDERYHACAILARYFPNQFADLLACLKQFQLRKSYILTPGGRMSPISVSIDTFLRKRGWTDKSFDIKIVVDESPIPTPTHKIDNFKNRVGNNFRRITRDLL